MPSPRDIPDVTKWWHLLPYHKYIVKYKQEHEAYREAQKFFLEHTEYTHFVICPDDLEIPPEQLSQLLFDMMVFDFQTISGYCNLDESMPSYYAIQPLGCNFSLETPDMTFSSWYKEDKEPILPKEDLIEVGHSGFACQVISRELMEKIDWHITSGNFDWAFSQQCDLLHIPLMVDTRVKLWHRRKEQHDRVHLIRNGYSYLVKSEM